jgi:hypothetical protein
MDVTLPSLFLAPPLPPQDRRGNEMGASFAMGISLRFGKGAARQASEGEMQLQGRVWWSVLYYGREVSIVR